MLPADKIGDVIGNADAALLLRVNRALALFLSIVRFPGVAEPRVDNIDQHGRLTIAVPGGRGACLILTWTGEERAPDSISLCGFG